MAGVRRIYGATSLTGTNSGSLADIDNSILQANDMAVVKAEEDLSGGKNPGHTDQFDGIYFYRYALVGATQELPKVIKPNNAGTTGRWLLISPTYFMENIEVEPGKKVVTNEIKANSTDLYIQYNDGSVNITIGDDLVTFDTPTLFNQPLTVNVSTGTSPFTIYSTTQVPNLNASYVGNVPITQICRLNNNTNKFSVIPQVTDETTIVPSDPKDFVTVQYLTDTLSSSADIIDHGELEPTSLLDDDHPQYIRTDSTRAFVNTSTFPKVSDSGILPSSNAHLTTKVYVDGLVTPISTTYVKKDGSVAFTGVQTGVTPDGLTPTHLTTVNFVSNAISNLSHSSLSNLGADTHTQYIRVVGGPASGGRAFTGLIGYANGTIVATATDNHFITKAYVDSEITNITDVYVTSDGVIPFSGLPQVIVSPNALGSINNPGAGYTAGDGIAVTTTDVETESDYGDNNLLVDIITDVSGTVVSASIGSTTGTGYRVGEEIRIVGGVGSGESPTVVATLNLSAGDPDLTPTNDWQLTTKEYVDSYAGSGAVLHDGTGGAAASTIHTAFPLLDGTRPFTGIQEGLAPPSLNADYTGDLTGLVTKGWVRTELVAPLGQNVIPHESLVGLGNDEHPLYILEDGSREFSGQPFVANNGVTPNFYPSQQWDLATVEYVDTGISTLGSVELVEYVDIYGRHAYVSNQQMELRYNQDPFVALADNEVTTKEYVDIHSTRFLLSSNDGWFDYFDAKIWTAGGTPTTIYDGTNTGVVVEKTTDSLGGIARVVINNGGNGFMVYDTSAPGWTPATFTGCWDASGNSGISITETSITFTDGASVDADTRIDKVLGDVIYINVFSGSTITATALAEYTFTIGGDAPVSQRAEWKIVMDGAGTAIASVEQVTGGDGYTYATDIIVADIPGITSSDIILRPYVVGSIAKVDVYDFDTGSGYSSASYNLPVDTGNYTVTGFGGTGTGFTVDIGTVGGGGELIDGQVSAGTSFAGTLAAAGYLAGQVLNVDGTGTGGTVVITDATLNTVDVVDSGSGYTGSSVDVATSLLGLLDLDAINPTDEKLKLSHRIDTTTGVLSNYTGGYTRTAGQVISTLTFNAEGHITGITEEGTGGASWLLVDELDTAPTTTALVLTANTNYFADTTGGAGFELRLPNTPPLGTTIVVDDYKANSSVNNITVNNAAGGNLLANGSSATATIIDVDDSRVLFTYIDETFGWRLKVY